MMTAIVQEAPHQTAVPNAIPPHVLIVGKKNAVDYIAPALFRLGSFGELVVRAKGSFSIVTAVNVAEMVKRDVPGLESKPTIGTEEMVIDGVTRRISFIEIRLALPAPNVEEPAIIAAPMAEVQAINVEPEAVTVQVPVIEAPVIKEAPSVVESLVVEEAAPVAVPVAPAEKLAKSVVKSKKIRAKAKTTAKKKAPARKKKAE
jgi:DNA-binding protein Alba